MKRYYILDDVRGLAVISMALYHLCWDLVNFAGVRIDWYAALPGRIWQLSICVTFITLSGFCRRLSRANARRGLTVLLSGAVVTAATALVMPDSFVRFGILTLIGSCMLLTVPLDKALLRVSPAAGLAVCAALFVLGYGVESGTAVFGLVRLPDWLYRNILTAYFGFPPQGFVSVDYYPLLPWVFLFAAGYFLCGALSRRGWLSPLERRGIKPLEWVGRHALAIYLLHQPVLAAIVMCPPACRWTLIK